VFALYERFGAAALLDWNARLVRELRSLLRARGIDAEPPEAPVRSTVVSLAVPDPDALLRRMEEARVVASVRAGRLRVALHFYNAPHELALLADLVAAPAAVGGAS
jgi:hypothetical protein